MIADMRSAAFIASTVAATLLASCARPKPPTITPHSAEVTSVTPAGLGIKAELDVYNPNDFALSVRSVTGTLSLGGVEVGKSTMPSGAALAASSTTRVPANLDVGWSNLAALVPIAASGQPVAYAFDGTATVGGERLNVDVPFRLQGQLTNAQLVQAAMRGLPGIPGFRVQ